MVVHDSASLDSVDLHVPVVIAGGGACGLTAGLAVRDAGVEALLVERDDRLGGSTAMSIGAICAVGSAAQARDAIVDGADAFVRDVAAKTDGQADPAMAATIGRESGATLDWLEQRHGFRFHVDHHWVGLGHAVPRLHLTPARSGEELLSLLAEAYARAGGALALQARVVAAWADADRRVRAVEVQRPDGRRERIGCDALVLATCGFGANHERVARDLPGLANARYFGHEGNDGSGIALGEALGAATANLSAAQGLGTLADPQQVVVPHTLLIDGGVLVNVNGERFTHELANISAMCLPVLAQPGGRAWVIADATRLAASLSHSPELRQLQQLGGVRVAETLEALASACRLPLDALTATIDRQRAACNGDSNDAFGRQFAGLAPLAAPFVAIRVTGALFHTQGGLVVDGEARVLDRHGRPLPNVYAGGGAATSIAGHGVTGYLPGLGLCMAVTLGRLAGISAARLAAGVVA